jgi:putative RecB family exonuclease
MIAPAAPMRRSALVHKPRSIDQLLEQVSPTRLGCFQQCRLKFYFRYVRGVHKQKSPALHVGTTVHAVLQAWNLARWRRTNVSTDELKKQFDHNWASSQQDEKISWDPGEEDDSKKTAWSMLETYFNETPITFDEKPEAVEVSMEADLTNHGLPKLIGVIDLVRKGGRIVDFKTTGQTPNPEKIEHLHETQTSAYAVLYREATGRKESGVELHSLVKLKTPKVVITSLPPMNPSQETRLFRIMESYVNGLQRDDFIPSPSPMACACCEYFNECRRWCGKVAA